MNCQHVYCGDTNYSYGDPLQAKWIVRHSGYAIPVCDPHYGVLRSELIGANINYTFNIVEGA
jgi:hypothetical protein